MTDMFFTKDIKECKNLAEYIAKNFVEKCNEESMTDVTLSYKEIAGEYFIKYLDHIFNVFTDEKEKIVYIKLAKPICPGIKPHPFKIIDYLIDIHMYCDMFDFIDFIA